MNPSRWHNVLIVAIFIAVFAVVLVMNHRPVGYLDFVSRSTQDFAIVADACDTLLRATQRDPAATRRLSGDDPALPSVLKDLRATQIEVAPIFQEGTNTSSRVRMTIGKANDQFIITWENSTQDNSLWELAVTREEMRMAVMSWRKNSASARDRRN